MFPFSWYSFGIHDGFCPVSDSIILPRNIVGGSEKRSSSRVSHHLCTEQCETGDARLWSRRWQAVKLARHARFHLLMRTGHTLDFEVLELDFEVLEDVIVGDHIVIPEGGIAWGTVTEAQPKRRMGRGGKASRCLCARSKM